MASYDPIELTLDSLPTGYDLTTRVLKTWKNRRHMDVTDYVYVDENPYVCTAAHTADYDNKPGYGSGWTSYWARALRPNARYIIGSGTTSMQQYMTDSTATPVARGASQAVEFIHFKVGDETTALTAATNKHRFRMPFAFYVTAIRGSLAVAQASGTVVTVDINEAGTTIISTKLTFDNTEKTTTTAATPYVISDHNIADDAEISVDVDACDGSTAACGLKITLYGYRLS